MRITVIPGQTGCLATRNVAPAPRRQKKDATQKCVVAHKKAPVVIIDEPRFQGGTLEKQLENTMTYRRYKRNVRAHNDRQHTRPRSFRQSI